MRHNIFILGALSLVQQSYGHYIFPALIVNGTTTTDWKYVRDIAGAGPFSGQGGYGKLSPIEEFGTDDLICNRNASAAGPKTGVATVLAGTEVGFAARTLLGAGLQTQIVHEGPGLVYMSKAPNDDVQNYDGKGDWFKIAYAGPSSNTTWQLFEKGEYRFTIPKTTPPGKYLLRMEHIYPWDKLGETQFYIACAQVNIVGPGGGKPTDFIRFPSGYKPNDPGLLIPTMQYENRDLLNYKPPGPAVWQG